jgi:hypothetical protein
LGTHFQRKKKENIYSISLEGWGNSCQTMNFVSQMDQISLKEAQDIKCFDPKNSFYAHTSLVKYSSYFSKLEQFEEGGGDNQNLPRGSIE